MFVLLVQAQKNFAVKQFQRNQLRKLHVFLQKLPSPDQEQQKRAAEETAQQSQQLEEAHKETLLLFSDVYAGVGELHQKTVTEILVHYGLPTFPGEYEQIVQLVEAAEAVESWETDKADKHVREAVALATEIKLRRKEVADSNLFKELDLVSLSSGGSSAGFENSDLPRQEDEPPEIVGTVLQENCGGESPDTDTDSSSSESEEPRTPPAAWTWQQKREQQGKYAPAALSHDRSAMMGGKMCRQQDGQTMVVRGKMAQPSASLYQDPRPMQRQAVLATAVQKVDPPKRSHNHAGYPFHAPRLARAMNASMGKELVGQLQEAETAQESNKRAKK